RLRLPAKRPTAFSTISSREQEHCGLICGSKRDAAEKLTATARASTTLWCLLKLGLFLLPVEYIFLVESLADDGGDSICLSSIFSKIQFKTIEGVIASLKNTLLHTTSRHIYILKAGPLLNQERMRATPTRRASSGRSLARKKRTLVTNEFADTMVGAVCKVTDQ
ncbi:hypothetical protein TYRP_023574, partial [Tyrophagus putrescentiae]